jgi:ankyrin repeat protein
MTIAEDIIKSIRENDVDLLKELVKELKSTNQSINSIKFNKYVSPLLCALLQETSNIEIINFLLNEAGSNPDGKLDDDEVYDRQVLLEPVKQALPPGMYERLKDSTIDGFFKRKIEAKKDDIKKRRTPLQAAASWGLLKIVDALIKAGANVDLPNSLGNTPLHLAAGMTCSSEIVDVLVKARSNVNAKNADGRTPLHLLAIGGASSCEAENEKLLEMAHILLEAKADVNAKDADGRTPLHLLAIGGASSCEAENEKLLEMAHILLEAKADVNAKDVSNHTALHYCLSSCNSLLLPLGCALIYANANVQLETTVNTNTNAEGTINLAEYDRNLYNRALTISTFPLFIPLFSRNNLRRSSIVKVSEEIRELILSYTLDENLINLFFRYRQKFLKLQERTNYRNLRAEDIGVNIGVAQIEEIEEKTEEETLNPAIIATGSCKPMLP